MNFDYQPPKSAMARPNRRKRSRALPLLLLVLGALTAALLLAYRPAAPKLEEPPAVVEIKAPEPPQPQVRRQVIEGTIVPGDTVTALLGAYVSPQELYALNRQSREVFPLSKICAGQPYKLCLIDDAFERFEYDIDRDDQLIITRGEEGFDVSRIPIAYTVETAQVRGTISTSLFEAVGELGEKPELALALADIFAWDIDFILDIRVGDSFQALVEKRFRDGASAGYGRILAAEFTNQGRTYRAFLYRDGERAAAYYDEDGASLRKAFLRAPLSFSRISSGFTMRRYHPITKTWKAHPAIDYAAPTGTPIKTVGDGTIVKIGRTQYNGNFIKIRHNSSYETLYLHMSRFARGMKKGKKLSQGQTIGYVGSTGLATGPHLCFRMYRNGSPVNPNKVRAKSAPPVSAENLADFKASATPLLAQLTGETLQAADLQPKAAAAQ